MFKKEQIREVLGKSVGFCLGHHVFIIYENGKIKFHRFNLSKHVDTISKEIVIDGDIEENAIKMLNECPWPVIQVLSVVKEGGQYGVVAFLEEEEFYKVTKNLFMFWSRPVGKKRLSIPEVQDKLRKKGYDYPLYVVEQTLEDLCLMDWLRMEYADEDSDENPLYFHDRRLCQWKRLNLGYKFEGMDPDNEFEVEY